MRRLLPFALAALLAVTLLPGLAAVEALDWREARDSTVAVESTTRREWVIPTLGHEAWFEKPVAGYAHEMLAARLLRRLVPGALSDVACSRLARAVLAIVLALLVAMIGQRCFGARAGWLGACALASMVALPLTARADGTQLSATLCAWLAIGGFLSLANGRRDSNDATRLLSWLGIAAAALTGGPLSALWPRAGFALYFALARTKGLEAAAPGRRSGARGRYRAAVVRRDGRAPWLDLRVARDLVPVRCGVARRVVHGSAARVLVHACARVSVDAGLGRRIA